MNTWMVRAGRGGRYFQGFLENGSVAIGWNKLGDLTKQTTRDEFLSRTKIAYPEMKQQAAIVSAGQVFRFWREMKEGDRIVTYDPKARSYLCGVIEGPSRFDPDEENPELSTKRKVNWQHETPRDNLSTTSLNTLGAILTLFNINSEVSLELWTKGLEKPASSSIEIDDALPQLTIEAFGDQDIEQIATEAIKDRIAGLDWETMQELVAGLLRAMGYRTVVSPPGSDRGKDIIASPDGLGFEEPKIVVEVKHRPSERMSSSDIRSFIGGRHPKEKGLYVSTGGFTKDAYYEAERAQIPLTLMDFERLVATILDYYHKFDEDTRLILPLRKLYWPVK